MSTEKSAPPQPGEWPGATMTDDRANRAYRRAWWAFALYPVSFVAAFVIGEGILSALTDDTANPSVWQVLVAGVPALAVFVTPGILCVTQGRRAMKLGRRDGQVPALLGAVIAVGFVGLNLTSYLIGRIVG